MKRTFAIALISLTSNVAAPSCPDANSHHSTMIEAEGNNKITKTQSYAGRKRKAEPAPFADRQIKFRNIGDYNITQFEREVIKLDAADAWEIKMHEATAPNSPCH